MATPRFATAFSLRASLREPPIPSENVRWNAQAKAWESKARAARAAMRAQYEKQLEQYRVRRDAAMAELRRLQGASADAWQQMMRGMDEAMKSMQDAFERVRKSFDAKRDKQ